MQVNWHSQFLEAKLSEFGKVIYAFTWTVEPTSGFPILGMILFSTIFKLSSRLKHLDNYCTSVSSL